VQLVAWYKIRDTLLGDNYVEQDWKKALVLAAVCDHPSAVWMTKMFAGREVCTAEDVLKVFRECEHDARALCLAGVLVGAVGEVRRAADLGDAFAQAWMAEERNGQERFQWAVKSAAQGEREGYYSLGWCYKSSIGCNRHVSWASENLLNAAELGFVDAMIEYGFTLEKTKRERFSWLQKGAVGGSSFYFLEEVEEQVRLYKSGCSNARTVFIIGRLLRGHIDMKKRTMFGSGDYFACYINSSTRALHFCIFQLKCYRRAVDVWTMVARRNGVCRDIRTLVGKLVWDSREETKYSEPL
jgi:hypothetical protein